MWALNINMKIVINTQANALPHTESFHTNENLSHDHSKLKFCSFAHFNKSCKNKRKKWTERDGECVRRNLKIKSP